MIMVTIIIIYRLMTCAVSEVVNIKNKWQIIALSSMSTKKIYKKNKLK